MRRPLNGSPPITNGFNVPGPYVGGLHKGTDYAVAVGTSVFATENATVTFINVNQPDTGNAVEYKSDDGVRVWRSLHLNSYSVSKGQRILEGQVIGYSGNTGNSTGPHLHQDVKVNGTYADPESIYGQGGSSMATVTDDNSRQLGWHFLGRNGYDGKPQALTSRQDDLYGKELTPAFLSGLFLSPEGREWRDQRVPQVYAERDGLRSTVDSLNTQITQLTKAVADLQFQVTAKDQAIAELTAERDALKAENEALKKKLLECGATPPPTPATDQVVIKKDDVWTAFVTWVNNIFKKG